MLYGCSERLPPLSTIRLQLGPNGPSWALRQSGTLIHNDWGTQHHHGLGSLVSTDAGYLGFADAHREQDRAYRSICNWFFVSPSPPYNAGSALIYDRFSVCIISAVRLHALLTVDYNDATYSVTTALIWSMLEPSLGIILACVPVLKNLVPRVFSGFSGGSARRDQDATPPRRDALDEHPLSPVGNNDDMYTSDHEAIVGEDGASVASGGGAMQRDGPLDKTRGILVTQQWEVR